MPTFNVPLTIASLLLVSINPAWTTDTAIIAAGAACPMGTVLAKVGGKYLALDPAGVGDAAVAKAVAAETVDATAGDLPGVVIARGAAVESTALVWPAGITDPQKATAIAELEARGIVVRTSL